MIQKNVMSITDWLLALRKVGTDPLLYVHSLRLAANVDRNSPLVSDLEKPHSVDLLSKSPTRTVDLRCRRREVSKLEKKSIKLLHQLFYY